MKQYLTQIKQGLIFGITASIVICSSIYLLKATRSNTNPWWDASPNDLYVSNGETLKASKRNSAMDKLIWKEMDLNDTTTTFNVNCERKRYIWSSAEAIIPSLIDWTELRYRDLSSARQVVKPTNKKQSQKRDGGRITNYQTINKLIYRCP